MYHKIPAAVESNMVSITEKDGYRIIAANGIPNHITGQFPNSNNPNSIQAQNLSYRVALAPQRAEKITYLKNQPFGVALNGIPFDPATAECYGQSRGSRPNPNCEWKEEAIVNGEGQLGLDNSNAHVQPNGTYHYHGFPTGLVKILGHQSIVHVGYAADGFPIFADQGNIFTPAYRLKSGTRPSGPGGAYDGTYTNDYEFVTGLGNLDACNGREITYYGYSYFITQSFPYIPRCWSGTPDSSFYKKGGSSGSTGNMQRPRGPHPYMEGGEQGRRPPPPPRRF